MRHLTRNPSAPRSFAARLSTQGTRSHIVALFENHLEPAAYQTIFNSLLPLAKLGFKHLALEMPPDYTQEDSATAFKKSADIISTLLYDEGLIYPFAAFVEAYKGIKLDTENIQHEKEILPAIYSLTEKEWRGFFADKKALPPFFTGKEAKNMDFQRVFVEAESLKAHRTLYTALKPGWQVHQVDTHLPISRKLCLTPEMKKARDVCMSANLFQLSFEPGHTVGIFGLRHHQELSDMFQRFGIASSQITCILLDSFKKIDPFSAKSFCDETHPQFPLHLIKPENFLSFIENRVGKEQEKQGMVRV